ncbi:MAG: hypothetical protein ACKO85_02695, partial [Isosphaeraceae bacterium]
MSPHFRPIAINKGLVYVTNTPADTVDVIDSSGKKVISRIHVGVNPAGLAIRPGGRELWVANHVSDSVSIIDIDPASPLRFADVATIQEIDPKTRSTRFDEPVGIVFAGHDKAYVSLSAENRIAVIDARSRRITKKLTIPAQDPRAMAGYKDRLYVLAFESNNQTQLSGGVGKLDGDLKTFDAYEHSIRNNNVLSLKAVVDIVKNPGVPDRDLFVFDTADEEPRGVVSGLGTLLYGMTIDNSGQIFIAQTDARNDVNGRSGTKKHSLKELENRPFLNRVTQVSPSGNKFSKTRDIDLEPLPPKQPLREEARATPFGIEASPDGRLLYVTSAGSDKLLAIESASGKILVEVAVGAVPEGIAIESAGGRPLMAWVYNAAADSVSAVKLDDDGKPGHVETLPLEDPTGVEIKQGRIAFSTARASSTATFSCASCHPDGNTDQLLWVLNTPIVSGGDQIQPRSTMPVRGLRDTAPFHWDGVPGDPYGGINSASIHKAVPPNSDLADPASSTRHLVDGGLASTMLMAGDLAKNDENKVGYLSRAERNSMSHFLLSVLYPPAQRRAYDNTLSDSARRGFSLFHIEGDLDPSKPAPNVCGDCHRMPFLVSTNTPGTGMDAPTWRGAYDRWLILPQGRLNIVDFDFYRRVAESGNNERFIWQFSWGGRPRFNPVWDMVLEGSTGVPGAYARQFTLTRETVDDPESRNLLVALEESARQGQVILQAEGVLTTLSGRKPVELEFDPAFNQGVYVNRSGESGGWPTSRILQLAAAGELVLTLTARLGENVGYDAPQPALWTTGPIQEQRGRQRFPRLGGSEKTMKLSGRHILPGAKILVNGSLAQGTISTNREEVTISLASLPKPGTHFLQVQN